MANLFRKPGKKTRWACYYVGEQRIRRSLIRRGTTRVLLATSRSP
jgi:hypothetical protein